MASTVFARRNNLDDLLSAPHKSGLNPVLPAHLIPALHQQRHSEEQRIDRRGDMKRAVAFHSLSNEPAGGFGSDALQLQQVRAREQIARRLRMFRVQHRHRLHCLLCSSTHASICIACQLQNAVQNTHRQRRSRAERGNPLTFQFCLIGGSFSQGILVCQTAFKMQSQEVLRIIQS